MQIHLACLRKSLLTKPLRTLPYHLLLRNSLPYPHNYYSTLNDDQPPQPKKKSIYGKILLAVTSLATIVLVPQLYNPTKPDQANKDGHDLPSKSHPVDMPISSQADKLLVQFGHNSHEYAQQLYKDAQVCRSPWSLEEAERLLHTALNIYTTIDKDKSSEVAQVYEELGNLYFLWETVYPGSKLEETRNAFSKAAEIYEALGEKQAYYNAEEDLALTYRNDLKEAQSRFESIVTRRVQDFGDGDIYLGKTYLRMAGILRAHSNEKGYQRYMGKYREVLERSKDAKTPKAYKISCYNEVVNQCMMRIMDDVEAKRGIEALQNVNKLLDPNQEKREIVENKISIAMLRTQMEQYEATVKECKDVLRIAESTEITRGSLLETYRMLLHAYGELGEVQQAENVQKMVAKLEKEKKFWVVNISL